MISIGEYKLIKCLDKGTCGDVYLTSKIGTSRLYATKRIPRSLADKPNYQKYLNNEISLLKEINHKNIIKLEDIKQTPNEYFIITDYINGGNLTNCLQKYKMIHGKSFPEEVVQHLMRQIVDAVRYLHSKKIIHRDLKLDNIMLNFHKEEDKNDLNILKAQVKIIDFGFATKLKNKIKANSVLGSPFNMDPILLKKFHGINNLKKFGYGPEADIWSLGALCYQMLIGETTFDGFSMEELLENVEIGNYTLPTSLSKETVSFINGMLQYEGYKRLSAEELSMHEFLTKNIQDFSAINLNEISDKVNGSQIMINIKKNKTIWSIFNKDNEIKLNSIRGNFYNYNNSFINNSYINNTINVSNLKNNINNNTNMVNISNIKNINNINNNMNNMNMNNYYRIPYNNFIKPNLRNRVSGMNNIVKINSNNNIQRLNIIDYKNDAAFGKLLGNFPNTRNNIVNYNRGVRWKGIPNNFVNFRYGSLPVYSKLTNPVGSYSYSGGVYGIK